MAKIGELGVDTPGGVVKVPVYELSDFSGSVLEVLKVQTPSGVGAVPALDPSQAAFPYLKLQTANNGLIALHDDPAGNLIDSFEDNDLSEYGVVSNASTSSNQSKDGTYSIKIDSSGAPEGAHSTSGLPVYPSEGDSWRVWMRHGSTGDSRIQHYWAVQSETIEPNGYYVWLSRTNNNFRIYERVGGSESVLTGTSQSYSASTWYEVQIDWASNGDLTATLYDESGSQLNQISTAASSFSSGGVGFEMHTGFTTSDTCYQDYARLV